MSIGTLDLNLLTTLHTVLTERSVARAAERLHVTPSAVSNALARLRDALGDPLVTRRGRGVVPTPRASELAPVLARALAELEAAVQPGSFDPASCTRRFTLAVADVGQIVWAPRLAELLRAEMPHARLRIVGIDSLVSLGDLASPEVDLHVGLPARAPGLHVEPLLELGSVLVAAHGHPAVRKRPTLAALGAFRHVGVEMVPVHARSDPLTATYARAGARREVALSVPTFTAAAAVAAATDLLATLPEPLFNLLGAPFGLSKVSSPVAPPKVVLALSWHERTQADPSMACFRALVRRAFVGGASRPSTRPKRPRN